MVKPTRVMGVDVAWRGADDSGYFIRCRRALEDHNRWHGYDPYETSNMCKERYLESLDTDRQIDAIVVDTIGYGAGVYANLLNWLSSYNVQIYDCDVNTKPNPEEYHKFKNLRALLWWRARKFFRDEKPYFLSKNHLMVQFCDELTWPQFKPESIGKRGEIQVEDKDETRARFGGKSPDGADMFVMTLFVEYDILTEAQRPEPFWKRLQRQKRGSGKKSFMLV